MLRRREIHSGRAISVSAVEWSVADKAASPTSALEGYMWDKEAEVDRFRERVPLSNLVSQCKMGMIDPDNPGPRDWIGAVRGAAEAAGGGGNSFVIVPECKRTEPTTGALWKRYDPSALAGRLADGGAAALSVNCDQVLFGGSLEDISRVREGTGKSDLPLLASDLLLYPYQLYKLRLAGADAVTLVVGALEPKDLLYLTKISATLGMQILASVSSDAQIRSISSLAPGSVVALSLSNRDMEDFSFDMTGERALSMLRGDALAEFREKNGDDVPVLVEGRVGIIERSGNDDDKEMSGAARYIKEIRDAGAFGAIVGGGLATGTDVAVAETMEAMRSGC